MSKEDPQVGDWFRFDERKAFRVGHIKWSTVEMLKRHGIYLGNGDKPQEPKETSLAPGLRTAIRLLRSSEESARQNKCPENDAVAQQLALEIAGLEALAAKESTDPRDAVVTAAREALKMIDYFGNQAVPRTTIDSAKTVLRRALADLDGSGCSRTGSEPNRSPKTSVPWDAADRAAQAVIRELSGRRGLRHEWKRIDPETRREIRRAWAKAIRTEFSKEALSRILERQEAVS